MRHLRRIMPTTRPEGFLAHQRKQGHCPERENRTQELRTFHIHRIHFLLEESVATNSQEQ